jgi:hypothetical protein
MHGDMDDNVHRRAHHCAGRRADPKANKTFDLLVLPDMDHNVTQHPYVIRRTLGLLRRAPAGRAAAGELPVEGAAGGLTLSVR